MVENDFENQIVSSVDKISIKTSFVKENDDIDRSTIYSFDGHFQPLHADVGSLEVLGKSAAGQRYCLLFVDLLVFRKICSRSKILTPVC